jgi:2-polyprenyl-3-methyl-5-hydroxy-6-metoxy-1,4-benzoquinol methylase
MQTTRDILKQQSPATLEAMRQRWDKEWIHYFRRAPEYFTDSSTADDQQVRERVNAVRGNLLAFAQSRPSEAISRANPIWHYWAVAALPHEIHGTQVADLGCGPGAIGRTMGHITSHFLGIDYAELPLAVARIVSPTNCTYICRRDTAALEQFYGTRTLVFSRSVFIHQNYAQARILAALASLLLKRGGHLIADFFDPADKNLEDPHQRGISRLAKDDLDPDKPTVGFFFNKQEIQTLGAECGFKVVFSEPVRDGTRNQWRIVRFEKL